MILVPPAARRSASCERPIYQWEPARDPHALTLRLFGRLGARELRRVVETLLERGRSPRDLVTIDLEQVEHLDYRALPEFSAALARHRDRGAVIWLIGLSEYVQNLFNVAGQGPILRRLVWNPEGNVAPSRREPFALDPRVTAQGRAHRSAWH